MIDVAIRYTYRVIDLVAYVVKLAQATYALSHALTHSRKYAQTHMWAHIA